MTKKIAILGCWNTFHTTDYVKDLIASDKAEIAAVWDEDQELGSSYGRNHALPFEPDLDKLLSRSELDGVIVSAAPTGAPFKAIAAAARAGKPILTDHVYAYNRSEAAALAEIVLREGVPFAMDLPQMSWPIHLAAAKALEDGWIGEVTSLRIRNAHDGASSNTLPPRFLERAYGVSADLGAHALYMMNRLLGKPVSVLAASSHMTGKPGTDNTALLFEFAGGAVAAIESSYVAMQSPYAIEIYGTKGCFLGRADSGKHRRLLRKSDAVICGFAEGGRALSQEELFAGIPEPAEPVTFRWLDSLDDHSLPLAGLSEGTAVAQLLGASLVASVTGRKTFI